MSSSTLFTLHIDKGKGRKHIAPSNQVFKDRTKYDRVKEKRKIQNEEAFEKLY